jgi:uncharacterized protein YcbK (DUF882 family)
MNLRLSRRAFLKFGTLATLASSGVAYAATARGPRRLAFHNLHTGEKLELAYWAEGLYLPDALEAINQLLRDHRNDEVAAIDTRLLDLLNRLDGEFKSAAPFEVISAYRSPASNQLPVDSTSGVARRSLHMEGRAIDLRRAGGPLDTLHRAALSLQVGGVGHYPVSGFVHLDVGRVRNWTG